MKWKLDKNRPICPQICEQLCAHIAAGEFLPKEKLMSVREMAVVTSVNPNTVQHAFAQLEAQGILYSERGSGWYIAADTQAAKDLCQTIAHQKISAFFEDMSTLGLSAEEIQTMVKEWKT